MKNSEIKSKFEIYLARKDIRFQAWYKMDFCTKEEMGFSQNG